MPENHASSVRDKLEYLYPGRGDEIDRRIQVTLQRFQRDHPPVRRGTALFSESDAVLICYADHVREPGVKTLSTLSKFLIEFVNGIIPRVHILPFFPFSSDDGFSVIDYLRVGDEYGTWDDIDALSHDFDLMFDLVINHASASSEWFHGFLRGEAPFTDYFIAFETPVDVSAVFRPRTHPLLTRFETASGPRYVWTTFSEDQIDVDFSNPDVLLEYLDILLFYVAHGAHVIRLDAIAFLWKELGTRCVHLKQTHTVVKLLRQILEIVAPLAWIITETNVPHAENISYFGEGADEAHLVYNFALPPLLLYSFLNGDAATLTSWAVTLAPPSDKATFFNFTASHDGIGVTALRSMISPEKFDQVLRAVEQRGGRISYRSVPDQEPVPYELNIVFMDAVGGPEPFVASQAIALSLQGVPGIYFNSFVGAQNWAEGVRALGYNRAINREKFGYHALASSLNDPASTNHRVYDAYKHMLEVRRKEPLFSPLAPQIVLTLHSSIFAVLRHQGDKSLLALTNVSADTVVLDGNQLAHLLGKQQARNILNGNEIILEAELPIEPYGVVWLI